MPVIAPLVAWLLSAFSSVLVQVFGAGVARFLASKLLLTGFFVVVLPLILNNFIYDLIAMAMEMVNNSATTGGSFNGSMTYSGLAAHYIRLLCLPECMAVFVSALCLRVTLKLIPFIKL